MELNVALKEGKSLEDYPVTTPKTVTPGGPGSAWRMMKLRRVYETAEEEGKPVEEVALDRFGSMEAFEEAVEERRVLDEREGRRATKTPAKGKGREGEPARGFMFNDFSRSHDSSRSSSFRRPELGESGRFKLPASAAIRLPDLWPVGIVADGAFDLRIKSIKGVVDCLPRPSGPVQPIKSITNVLWAHALHISSSCLS